MKWSCSLKEGRKTNVGEMKSDIQKRRRHKWGHLLVFDILLLLLFRDSRLSFSIIYLHPIFLFSSLLSCECSCCFFWRWCQHVFFVVLVHCLYTTLFQLNAFCTLFWWPFLFCFSFSLHVIWLVYFCCCCTINTGNYWICFASSFCLGFGSYMCQSGEEGEGRGKSGAPHIAANANTV